MRHLPLISRLRDVLPRCHPNGPDPAAISKERCTLCSPAYQGTGSSNGRGGLQIEDLPGKSFCPRMTSSSSHLQQAKTDCIPSPPRHGEIWYNNPFPSTVHV